MTDKKSVVLVDDDKDILAVLKKGLEANNYQVYAFDNPVKALQYIESTNSPQVLISDIRMPGMQGFELARRTKEHHSEMKVILLTAFEIAKPEFDRVFPSASVDALIEKPMRIRELIDTVEAVMTDDKVV